MINLFLTCDAIFRNNVVLATDAFSGPVQWSLFLLFSIIGAAVAGALLFTYSKKPEDWKHESKIEGCYYPNRLGTLADTIKKTPVDYSDDAPIKKLVKTIFFEKIRSTRELSDEEISRLNENDKNKIRRIIKDEEIANWLFDTKRGKKDRINTKEKYLTDINSILDKMEALGK